MASERRGVANGNDEMEIIIGYKDRDEIEVAIR